MISARSTLFAAIAGVLWLTAAEPSLGGRAVQGSVAEVTAQDGAALSQAGFRIWSALPGGETNINDASSSCRNLRCSRPYTTNSQLGPGGFIGPVETTLSYNGDAQDSPFYMLVDARLQPPPYNANRITYFGVAGVSANNFGIGSFLADACGGTMTINCFERLDSTLAAPPLDHAYVTYGSPPGTIRAIGGLNPVPNVLIMGLTDPANSIVQLAWHDPQTYAGAMRPSTTAPAPPSPVKGVRLWKNERIGSCTDPADDDPGWASVGTFDLGHTTAAVALSPGAACTFFALTVRLVGPGGGDAEIETGQQGSTHFVGVNSYPMPCNDGNPCTADFFVPGASGQPGYCSGELVEHGTSCAIQCYQGFCDYDQCEVAGPVVCAASDPCHLAGTCDPATSLCSNPTASDGTACNDGNACTIGDTCLSGSCAGAASDPGEVMNLTWTIGRKDAVEWDTVPSATGYTLYRGAASSLQYLLTQAVDSCTRIATSAPSTGGVLTEAQGPGNLFWYLARATNGTCEGSAGLATAGRRQQNSAGACP